jgi:hypothetical protein
VEFPQIRGSIARSTAVAPAALGGAIAWLGQLAIGTDAVLGVDAPVQTVIRRLHGGIVLGKNELSLPAKR